MWAILYFVGRKYGGWVMGRERFASSSAADIHIAMVAKAVASMSATPILAKPSPASVLGAL